MQIETIEKSERPKGHAYNSLLSSENLISKTADDLVSYLNGFPNQSFALKNMAKASGLSERTLRRILKKENIPTPQTLHKLYVVLTQAKSDKDLFEKCPDLILSEFKKSNFEVNSYDCHQSEHKEFFDLIKNESIAAEIYVLLAQRDLDISFIVYHYGKYGADVLLKIETLGLAKKVNHGLYRLSEEQPFLDAKYLRSMGLRLVKRFFNDDEAALEGSNFVGLYVEGLNEQGIKKWLELDEKCFKEKLEMAKDPQYKGEKTYFTFQSTDIMDLSRGKANL